MTELAALAAYETRAGVCRVHQEPDPCAFCDRFLPMVLDGQLVTFDLDALSADERRGARAIARMISQRLAPGLYERTDRS